MLPYLYNILHNGGRVMSKHSVIPKEELEDLYLIKHLTLAEIGKIYGKSRQRIWQLIKIAGIVTDTAERFFVQCPQCNVEFETTRKRFRNTALRYCSPNCYHTHRASCSSYNPSRTGQRQAKAIMEAHLGRSLHGKETIHHLDGDCKNNNIDNLILFASHAEHMRYHHQIRIKDKELGTTEHAQACMVDKTINGAKQEARLVMSKHLGRALQAGEIIHHLDGNCQNNDLSNLVLFPNHSAHVKWHHLIRQVQYVK